MRIGILGKKIGMTQIFDENGLTVPVTVIDTTDCVISQVKQKPTDGYTALQLAIGAVKPQNVSKVRAGHFKKAGTTAKFLTQEIRLTNEDSIAHLKAGQPVSPALFRKGDKVDVSGISKGRGFQGVMKRHNFHGADATHGVHEYYRHGGSIGTKTFPGRVRKNKKMPGQMGNTNVTVPNVEVVDVREKENLILLKGAVPGFENTFVMIQNAVKGPQAKDRTWGTTAAAPEAAAAEAAPQDK